MQSGVCFWELGSSARCMALQGRETDPTPLQQPLQDDICIEGYAECMCMGAQVHGSTSEGVISHLLEQPKQDVGGKGALVGFIQDDDTVPL